MNDMAKMFLTAQEFITPMQSFGGALETMTQWATDTTGKLNTESSQLFEHILGGNASELQENNNQPSETNDT